MILLLTLLVLQVQFQIHLCIQSAATNSTNFVNETTFTENAECRKYQNKKTIDPSEYSTRSLEPTLLFGFPSSGSTWIRSLIETATGTLTGSLYSSKMFTYPEEYNELLRLFSAESRCGKFLALNEAVTQHVAICNTNSSNLCFTNKDSFSKCKRGTIYDFSKFIFIARNPIDMMITDFFTHVSTNYNSSIEIQHVSAYFYQRWMYWSAIFAETIQIEWDTKIYPLLRDANHNLRIIKFEDTLDFKSIEREMLEIQKYLNLSSGDAEHDLARAQCAHPLNEHILNRYLSPFPADILIFNNDTFACQLWDKLKYYYGNLSYTYPFPVDTCGSILGFTNTENLNNQKLLKHSISNLTVEYCQAYKLKSYIDPIDVDSRDITLLLSLPGSGNTWARFLVETVTGVFSGSIYPIDDSHHESKWDFVRENHCGKHFSVIKAHPFSMELCENGNELCYTNGPKAEKLHCSKRGKINSWKKILYLVRDPMKSILSEFQRHVSGYQARKKISKFFHSKWAYWAQKFGQELKNDWDNTIYPLLTRRKGDSENFHIVRYENLTGSLNRIQDLQNVARFLNFPTTVEQSECAFILSDEIMKEHRQLASNTIQLHAIMNNNIQLACTLWSYIEAFSGNFSYVNPFPELTSQCASLIHIDNHDEPDSSATVIDV